MFMHSILFVIFYMVDTLFCQVVNVAEGNPAEQSSTLNYYGFNWTADKAVDDCLLRSDPDTQQCCSATDGGNSSWKLNLTRQYHVQTVDIFGRRGNPGGNQLDGFELSIIEAADGDEQFIPPVNSTNDTFTFTFPLPRRMTEVIIRRKGIMTLCEVQVFAVCDDGTYGKNCTNFCGQCRHSSACNKTTGECPEGCEAGFIGVLCNETCESGKWGLDCRSSCANCQNGTVCHFEEGHCPSGCEAGWEGDRCDTGCQRGTWGQNCRSKCGNCLGNSPCYHINGTCLEGCETGWLGFHCVAASQNKDETTAIVGGAVGGGLAVVVACVAVLVWRKRNKSKSKRTQKDNLEDYINPVCDTTTDNTDCDSVEYKDSRKSMYQNVQANPATVIAVSDLREFCRTKCVEQSSLFGEFDDIPYGLQYECKVAVSEQNKKKNRYKDMYPCKILDDI